MSDGARAGSARIWAWILLILLIVSAGVNLFTLLSLRGLKRTVDQMREPVNNYFSAKLYVLEDELDELLAESSENGKSPYRRDARNIREQIEKARELWTETGQATGARWVRLFWRAQQVQEDLEESLEQLQARAEP